ncbi:MAG: hypothetical protein ABJN40_09400 [Sneathiella sp.]
MSSSDDTSTGSIDAVISQLVSTDSDAVGGAGEVQEELVDLDLLFDALNIAAEQGSDGIDFQSAEGQSGGILTVTNEALTASTGSTGLDPRTDDAALKGPALSDES